MDMVSEREYEEENLSIIDLDFIELEKGNYRPLVPVSRFVCCPVFLSRPRSGKGWLLNNNDFFSNSIEAAKAFYEKIKEDSYPRDGYFVVRPCGTNVVAWMIRTDADESEIVKSISKLARTLDDPPLRVL